jgi:GDP-4-dehydro-6-deoxy-D-mannose reductase
LKLLITGASGFVGKHVAQIVPCIPLNDAAGETDLRDAKRVELAVSEIRPDLVIHLAASTFVPKSFESPRETYDINFFGTFNLLEGLASSGFSGTMVFVGTGDSYGKVEPEEFPISETRVLRPRSPYTVSKVAAEALCYEWSQRELFRIVLARPFNHIGAGQSARFVVSDLAKQVVEAKLGRRDPVIRAGNLDVTRDFTDVRDIVQAYIGILDRGMNGEIYNVCSGREISVRTVLSTLLEIAGIDARVEVSQDRVRRNEQLRTCGSYAKLKQQCGWFPKIGLKQSLTDIINDWHRVLG